MDLKKILIGAVVLVLALFLSGPYLRQAQASGQTLRQLINNVQATADSLTENELIQLTGSKGHFFNTGSQSELQQAATAIGLDQKLQPLWAKGYTLPEMQLALRLLIEPSKSSLSAKLNNALAKYDQEISQLTGVGVSEGEIFAFTVEVNQVLSTKTIADNRFNYDLLNAAYQTAQKTKYAALRTALKNRFSTNHDLLWKMLAGEYLPPEFQLVRDILYPGYFSTVPTGDSGNNSNNGNTGTGTTENNGQGTNTNTGSNDTGNLNNTQTPGNTDNTTNNNNGNTGNPATNTGNTQPESGLLFNFDDFLKLFSELPDNQTIQVAVAAPHARETKIELVPQLHQETSITSTDGLVTLTIPPLDQKGNQDQAPAQVKLDLLSTGETKLILNEALTASFGGSAKANGQVFEFLTSTPGQSSTGVNQAQPATITVQLTKLLTPGADPATIGVYRVDGITGKLTYVGGKLDPDQQKITARITTAGMYAVMAVEKNFNDTQQHWANQNIKVMAARLVAQGVNDQLFNPEGKVTRAQFTALLVRALGLQVAKPAALSFRDVKQSAWYYQEIAIAYANGLIKGQNPNQLGPEITISRAEMAVLLERALLLKNPPTTKAAAATPAFNDAQTVPSWARTSIARVAQLQLMQGQAQQKIAPAANTSRAEAVTVLRRLMDLE